MLPFFKEEEKRNDTKLMKELKDAVTAYLRRKGYGNIRLKAVLFDMDGVLYDSMKNHTEAWYKIITELGIPCSMDEFYMHEGRTGASTISLLYERAYGREATGEEEKRVYAGKTKYFNALPPAMEMPGAASVLNQVKESGIVPVLVTGSGQDSLLSKLDHSFPGIFDPEHMVTAFDVKKGKPDPEPYLKGMLKAGVKPCEAIVVENAPLGVASASAAGLFTIGVNTGPLDDRILLDAGADYILPSMEALAFSYEEIFRILQQTKI